MQPETRPSILDPAPDKSPGTGKLNHFFGRAARSAAIVMGTPWSFLLAVLTIVLWAIAGPLFGFSDTWQLVINTATTIVTFLMVFLIQNTQNRDAKAMHLKLDELIRALKSARNRMIDIESLADEDLKQLEEKFRRIRAESIEKHRDLPSST